jgi:molecular chaperone DnaK
MRRTFVLRTVEALSPADAEGILRVPIVQGEFSFAHLCRLVGALEIRAAQLQSSLPAGSMLEVTIELDRGGRLVSSARVLQTSQIFDGIAHLVSGNVPLDELSTRLMELSQNVQSVRARAFQRGVKGAIACLGPADQLLSRASRTIESAQGGDLDAAEAARRMVIEIDAALADAEGELAWPELDYRIREQIAIATSWIAELGSSEERAVLSSTLASVEKARVAKNAQEVHRLVEVIRRLGSAAYLRQPRAWEFQLDACTNRLSEASDPLRASRLIDEGRGALQKGDRAGVERAVRGIWELLPARADERALGHQSGIS